MIECNSRIAEYLSRTSIGIYRHHPEYNKVKLSKLNNYLQHLSWKLQTHQKDYLINDSLNKLLSKYDYNSLKYLILFNTPKAVYSTENTSHSNINRQFYTHVTSPIRRYVDLVIHRLLFNKLSYTINELNEIVKHINFIETRNNDAYRKNDDILVLKYINSQPINTIYNCRVIGMNKFNITLIVENLNYIINLPLDYFGDKLMFDEYKMILSEKYGELKIKPFDIIQMKVNKVDLISFKLDVEII
jgi:ribonuclease R